MTWNTSRKSRLTRECFSLPPLYNQQVISVIALVGGSKTYVCHESTRASPLLSTPLKHHSRRTTLQIHYVVLPKQRCGSSTGQGERASLEHPVVVGHLQDNVSLGKEIDGEKTTHVSSYSIRLIYDELRLRTHVSTSDTCSARDVPKSC